MIEGGGVQELVALPPGPALAVALAGVDPAAVPNGGIVDLLIAQSRQLAHDQARLWSVINEVLHRRPFTPIEEVHRSEFPELFAADEVRAALTWTRRAAEAETDLAFVLVEHLPLVLAAVSEGSIDRGRAVVFARHLADLTVEQATVICEALLPIAPRLTTGQLQERIKRMILEIDPDYYAARYQKALQERRLIHYLDADGAAVVTASGLPAEQAAAAMRRVDDLARAARRAGHPATLDQIRVEVFLVLLDGSVHGLSREQIIAALIARHAGDVAAEAQAAAGRGGGPARRSKGTGSGPGGSGSGGSGSDGNGPHNGGPHNGGPHDGGPHDGGPHDGGPDDGGPHDGGPHDGGPHDGGPGDGGPGDGGPDDGGSGTGGSGAGGAGDGGSDPGGWAGNGSGGYRTGGNSPVPGPGSGDGVDQRVGIEIRVPLLTLLGLAERAGELPGLGPITADTARRAVHHARHAQWRWAVVDPDGRLLTEGLTRRRPAHLDRNGPRGGIVELQITETDLDRLAADPAARGPWAGVISDIAEQHRRPEHGTDLDAHPEDRFPRAALRRHIEIRDRTCTAPGCRAPATRTDIDHTINHTDGGPTVRADLGPACRHDHTLKTSGGWHCEQPEPGHFLWTSPLGRTYDIQPEPILPPPATQTNRPPDPFHDEPARDTDRPLVAEPGPPRAPPPASPRRPTRRRDPFTLDTADLTGDTDPPPF